MSANKNQVEAFGGVMIDRQQFDDNCRELAKFMLEVEAVLNEVHKDHSKTKNFGIVAQKLVRIKGAARQMNLTHVADLAELAEELAIKGENATQRPIIRRVIGALWDSVTTLHHMLEQVDKDTSEEAQILIQRLDVALKSLGGRRPKVSNQDEVDALFNKKH